MAESMEDFIDGVVDGNLTDDRIVQWLREVYDNGMSKSEIIELTNRMMKS